MDNMFMLNLLSETYPMANYYLSPKQYFLLNVCVVLVHFVEKF